METPSVDKTQARAWIDHTMRGSALWGQFEYSTVMYASKDKVFVVWDYFQGLPRLIAALVVEKVYSDFDEGLRLVMHDLVSDQRLDIDQKPSQVVPGVYAWVPAFIEARFAPYKYDDPRSTRRLTVPFCVKTATHPTKALTSGHRYISTQADFESRWPNFK